MTTTKKFLWILVGLVAATVTGFSLFFLPTDVDSQEPFFSGKTLRILSGFSPGGSVDLRARLFARHLGKFIPGQPNVIVQNMAGAGGIIAANYTFGGAAAPDGLTMLHFPSSTIMNAILLEGRVQYDIRSVTILWVQADGYLTIINPQTSGVETLEDLQQTPVELAVGGSGATSLRSLRTKLAMLLFGVKHRYVTGYADSAALAAALDREEIHLFDVALASYSDLVQPREEDGTARILWQTGLLRGNGLFERVDLAPDVPTLSELLPPEKQSGPIWEAWRAAVAPLTFQAVVGLPQGVPSDRTQVLSDAFEDMAKDRDYQNDFERILGRPPVDALVGEEAARVMVKGLGHLFDDFQQGIDTLRELTKE